MLLSRYRKMVAEGKPVPADIFTVGEFVRRNRPAMGVPP